jgi:integrase
MHQQTAEPSPSSSMAGPQQSKLFGKLPKPTFDFLTFEEAERLIDAAEPEWRALLVALKTCVRCGGRLKGLGVREGRQGTWACPWQV